MAIVFAVVGIIAVNVAASRMHDLELPKHEEKAPLPPNPLSAPAWSYFHPAWDPSENSPFLPIRSDGLGIPTGFAINVSQLVDDPKGKIEPEFKVPAYLKDQVLFWMQIHANFNSHMRIVHDRNNLSVIYGYLDFRPLHRVLGSTIALDVKSNQYEREILKDLKAKLSEAVGITKTHLLSAEEKEAIRSFLSRLGTLNAQAVAEKIPNIRTQTGQSDEFVQALYRSRILLPHIESVFKREGLPAGLGRIPFVESSFNLRAESKVGAVGIWQFMPETARQMIGTDEERLWSDPLRQTKSAARLFKIYRSMLPDWGTAITSYNAGVGRVHRLVQKYHAKDLGGILNAPGDTGLGFAGKNFFAQVLSANIIEAYKEELFDRLVEPVDSALVFNHGKPFPKETCGIN